MYTSSVPSVPDGSVDRDSSKVLQNKDLVSSVPSVPSVPVVERKMRYLDKHNELGSDVQLCFSGGLRVYLPVWAWVVMDGINVFASDCGVLDVSDGKKVGDWACQHPGYTELSALGKGLRFLDDRGWTGDLCIKSHCSRTIAAIKDKNATGLAKKCRDIIHKLSDGDIWDALTIPVSWNDHSHDLMMLAWQEYGQKKPRHLLTDAEVKALCLPRKET